MAMPSIKPQHSAKARDEVLLRDMEALHRFVLGSCCFCLWESLGQAEIYSCHSSLLADNMLPPPQIFLIENPVCENTVHLKCQPQRELSIYSVSCLLYFTQK